MINEVLRARSLIAASLTCSIVLAACALLDSIAARFLPCVLLFVSYALLLRALPHMLDKWRYVKRSTMPKGGLPWKHMVHSAATHLLTGIAYGIIAFASGHPFDIAIVGGAYFLSFIWANFYRQADLTLTQSQFRSFTTVIIMLLITFVPSASGIWKCILISLAVACITADMLNNVIAQAALEKDSKLSDVFYFGLRHAFNMTGKAIGFIGIYALLAIFGFGSTPIFVFLGCSLAVFVLTVQLSVGAYSVDAPRTQADADIVTVYVDPWHEKVMKVAAQHGLTERQTEIFDALSRGRNTRYIMGRLYLSEGTVKKQSHQIYRKLDVHNQQDLINIVLHTPLDSEEQPEEARDLMDQWKDQQRQTATPGTDDK